MRKLRKLALILPLAALAAVGSSWFTRLDFEPPRVTPAANCRFADMIWTEGFAATQSRAQKAGKPFLFLQLVGRLDDEFC